MEVKMTEPDARQNRQQSNNPLHGITLLMLLERLVAHYGWEELGARIPVRCFNHEPSLNSSLRFLRKTDWARAKVEALYLETRFPAGPATSSSESPLKD
jgi:uncharacterized protein (DUF2132 family)